MRQGNLIELNVEIVGSFIFHVINLLSGDRRVAWSRSVSN